MDKTAPSDAELLTKWLSRRQESAFHALVARYAGLVHMAAKRTCGDETLAAEACQLTFILLARKAKSLASRHSLAGWLHLTAVMQAKNLIRANQRENRKRESLRAAMDTATHANDPWREMQPVLDDALTLLSETDREALLLRFYRSLSVREVAATLSIATDAAQKRIDRAVERLRGKLVRRGVRASGTLAAAMATGFAADAQAAVPAIAILASKAITTGAVPSVFSIGLFAAMTMKTTSLAVSLVAMLTAGVWLASQRHSIAELQEQNASLEKRLTISTKASVRNGSGKSRLTTITKGPPNWKSIAEQLIALQAKDRSSYTKVWRNWQLQLASMSGEKLVGELDRIAALELSPEENALLARMFVEPLIDKDPEQALKRFPHDKNSPVRNELAGALREWVRLDREKALAWFDDQIAAGTFDEKSPWGGQQETRIQFEAMVFIELLAVHPGAADRRIAALPEGFRRDTVVSYLSQQLGNRQQIDFAGIVRAHIPPAQQAGVIAGGLRCLPRESGYAGITSYLDRIQATPTERARCAQEALITEIALIEPNEKLTRNVFDRFRAWAQVQAPAAVEPVTGRHIAMSCGSGGRMPVSDAAALAVEYFADSGNDEVLDPMFRQHRRYMTENAQALASAISDETLRERFLKRIATPISSSEALGAKLKDLLETP